VPSVPKVAAGRSISVGHGENGQVLVVIEAIQSHVAGKGKRPFTQSLYGAYRGHVHREHRRRQISTKFSQPKRCLIARDAVGPRVAYVYFEDEPGSRHEAG